MRQETERIEVSNKSIPCTPEEASRMFDKHSKAGLDVAWFTITPVLSLVKAHMAGLFLP